MGGLIDQIKSGIAQVPVKPAYNFATGNMKPQDVSIIQQLPQRVDQVRDGFSSMFRPQAPVPTSASVIPPKIRR
jgi:hypothetical protein